MAAIILKTHFPDTPEAPGLCPQCHNPAMKRYVIQKVDIEGITTLGSRVACTDCMIWIGPMEAHHD